MRSLIVAVDATDISANAARYAADMALAIDADVHLLHVVQIPVMPAEAPVGYVFEQLEKEGRVLLDGLSKELAERTRGQVNIYTLEEVGGVEYRIAECCRRIRPFAVIMGAPGGSFLRAVGGSTAVDAARHLPYPVLVIPPGAAFRRIHKIVLACELEDIGGGIPVTLSFLRELKEFFAARFDLVNISGGEEKGEDERVFEMYRWKEAMQDLYPELHFLRAASVLEGVDKYLGEQDADWLMVFPKEHGWLEFHRSQTKGLVSHCRVPVMSICEGASARQEEEKKVTGQVSE